MKESLHSIDTPRGVIRGMLHLPDRATYPLVLLFHGFQGNRIGSAAHLVDLSRDMAEAGIAVGRFDFIGSGESDGRFEDMTVSGELQDLYHIVANVEQICGEAATGLYLAGHSMGGSVAAMAAGEKLTSIDGLILLTPAGEVKERIADNMEALFDDRSGGLEYPVEINGQELGEAFKRDAESLWMLKTASAFKGPVLMIFGGRDETIPPRVADQFVAIFPQAQNLLIEECGHSFGSIACRRRSHKAIIDFILQR